MDKYFEQFLGLVEDAAADLPPAAYRQLMDDIHRVSVDKGAKPCPIPVEIEVESEAIAQYIKGK